MRMTLGLLSVCLLSWNVATFAAPPSHQIKLEHPGDTALSEDSPGKYVYKSFPSLMHLWVYDKDTPGKSNCTSGCSSAWVPLRVSTSEKGPVGDWTVITRADGTRQWAYRGHPVYIRYHDLPPDEGTAQEGFRPLQP